MAYLNFKGKKIYYEIEGNGTALILLHGWNGSLRSFKPELIQLLKKKHRVLLLDLPGYGKSDNIELSFDIINKLISRLLDKENVSKTSIFGFCMGAAFALDFALYHPLRIQSLYLVETSIEFPAIMNLFLIPVVNLWLLKWLLFTKTGWIFVKHYFRLGININSEILESFRNINLKNSLAYIKMLKKYSKLNHYERIKNLKPALELFFGQKTNISIRKSNKLIKYNRPDSVLNEIANAGHFIIDKHYNLICNIIDK